MKSLIFAGPMIASLISFSGAQAAPATGAALFAENCAACHQPKGEGIAGAFPALAKSVFVKGDPKLVAATILNGRGGMPAFRSDLNDAEIATVLTFVRAAWGNRAMPITPILVASARSAKMAEGPRKIMQAH
jgi:mono/diheme cytochrome c family protein